jgi:hypothetical protein
MFQFHSGSIKTLVPRSHRALHSGVSIPPGSIRRPPPSPSPSNSRLGFNSTLVRLDSACSPATHPHAARFQFHSGSIKTTCTVTNPATDESFNPLWSIRRRPRGHLARRSSFNSTLVRLRREFFWAYRAAPVSFNPLWFDKTNFYDKGRRSGPVSLHLVRLDRARSAAASSASGSIPLWFD